VLAAERPARTVNIAFEPAPDCSRAVGAQQQL
jgi:hypothetical protein